MMETTMQTVTTNEIEQITAEIIAYEGTMVQSAWEIGQRLIKAKGLLEHGAWSAWLTQRVNFSERKAQSYMRLAREYPNPQPVAGLGIRKALALLEVPAEERETFAEEHNAAEISARELEQAIWERDAAKKIAEDVSSTVARVSKERDAIQRELDELKSRPVEVAVQVDQQAVEKAAAEAKRKAEEAAAQKIEALSLALEEAKANSGADRAAQAEGEVERLKKELAIARNEDVLGVQIAFEQAKAACNRMQGHILRMEARGQNEAAANCRRAVAALAGKLAELGRQKEEQHD